jgi:heptosyltransferase-2
VIYSRNYSNFNPRNLVHEAEFNLNFLKSHCPELLGVENFGNYFVGDRRRNRQQNPKDLPILGFHAGSKSGHWKSKRWPYFHLLSRLLSEEYSVWSFGLKEEYVDETQDKTGGTIEETIKNLDDCDYFIGNDSGITHLAYAMGIPTIFIFGPTAVPARGPSAGFGTFQVVLPNKDCYPCEINDPLKFQSARCECIQEILPDRIRESLRELSRMRNEA